MPSVEGKAVQNFACMEDYRASFTPFFSLKYHKVHIVFGKYLMLLVTCRLDNRRTLQRLDSGLKRS